jgi:hypothetical protein
MQSLLVPLLFPADGERAFLLALKERRRHGCLDELPSDTCQLRHF